MLDLPPRAIRGLGMLADYVRAHYKKINLIEKQNGKASLKFGFFDILQIIIFMVACGIGIGFGIKLVFDPGSILN